MHSVTEKHVHGTVGISNHSESEGVLGADGLRISTVTYVKSYMHAFFHGVGEVQLQYRYSRDGKINFVGFELFSGAIGDRKGSVVFDITGSVNPDNNLVSAKQLMIKNSGSTEFLECAGEGTYVISGNGYCSFEFIPHS